MNTLQLERILKRTCKNDFCGVFARDQLPDLTTFPAFIIANTDESARPGTHWIATYVSPNQGEYFDSYGQDVHQDFVDYMNTYCTRWTRNEKQLQSVISSFCGYYYLFYIYMRHRNALNINEICNIFTRDTSLNDAIVHKFFCRR